MISFAEFEGNPQFVKSIELIRKINGSVGTLKLNLPHVMRNAKQVQRWVDRFYWGWYPYRLSEQVCLELPSEICNEN